MKEVNILKSKCHEKVYVEYKKKEKVDYFVFF